MVNDKLKNYIANSDFIKQYNKYGNYSLKKFEITHLYNDYVNLIESKINILNKQNNIILFTYLMDQIFYYLTYINNNIIELYKDERENTEHNFETFYTTEYTGIIEFVDSIVSEIADSFILYAENNNYINLIDRNNINLLNTKLKEDIEKYSFDVLSLLPFSGINTMYSYIPIEYSMDMTSRVETIKNVNLYDELYKYNKRIYVVTFLLDTKLLIDNELHGLITLKYLEFIDNVEKSEIPFNGNQAFVLEEF